MVAERQEVMVAALGHRLVRSVVEAAPTTAPKSLPAAALALPPVVTAAGRRASASVVELAEAHFGFF